MLKNNTFYINKLKNIVFIGHHNQIDQLVSINKSLNIKTFLITSLHQSKNFNCEIKKNIFNKINSKFINFLRSNLSIKETLFISIGSRIIFKKQFIEKLFLNNLVNIHCSRLPFDGGGADISWRILREDRIQNLLIHLIDETLDRGPIIKTQTNLFPFSCKIPIDYMEFNDKKFIPFYKNFIINLRKGMKFELHKQQEYFGRYNPRLNTNRDGIIDWSLRSYDLINFINAFDDPYKGASSLINNKFKKVFIKKAILHGGDSSNHPFMAGVINQKQKDWIMVSTGEKHMLIIKEVFDTKGINIINKLNLGDRFYTNSKDLYKSASQKTIYNSLGLRN
jgi:methionyl-tRNA formyltransferase